MKRTKMRRLTPKERIEIFESKESTKSLSMQYHVSPSSITKIKNKMKNEDYNEKIRLLNGENENNKNQKKYISSGHFESLENHLMDSIEEIRHCSFPVSGTSIKILAMEIYDEMKRNDPGIKEFTASNGWLHNFIKRHNLKNIPLHGESGSVDENEIRNPLNDLRTKILSYNEADVYNMDETGLFYRQLPRRSYTTPEELIVFGRKLQKNRVTITFCTNADGSEFITPLMIGKSKNPRCFINCNQPLFYTSNKKAWMTSEVFNWWLKNIFIEEVKDKQKVLLILDNAPSHSIDPNLQLNNVEIAYLPPNATSKIQPLDMGIIASIKKRYRYKIVENLLNKRIFEEKDISLQDCMKILDDIILNTNPNLIRNCWIKSKLIDSIRVDYFDKFNYDAVIPIEGYDDLSLQQFIMSDEALPKSYLKSTIKLI
jgi:hypothetical protein